MRLLDRSLIAPRPTTRRRARPAFLAVILCLAAACGPDPLAPEKYLALGTVAGDTLARVPADGFSRVTLVARIDPAAATTKRVIVFTTTDGLFVDGSNRTADGRQTEVTVDGTGRAVVDLQSVRTVSRARVHAQVQNTPGAANNMIVEFTPIGPAAVVRFDSTSLAAGADGLTVTPVTVRIDANVPADQRVVRFEAAGGTFTSGTTGADLGTAQVTVGPTNTVTIGLRSPAQPGTSVVRATVAGVTREIPITFRPVPADSILRFAASSYAAEADGQSVVTIAVRVSPFLRDAGRTVRFETTAGTFVTNATNAERTSATVVADQRDSARVDLRVPAGATTGWVRATVGGFTQEVPVVFRPALPDTILVDVAAFTVTANQETTITARLVRAVGAVARGSIVRFEAVNQAGQRVGQFRGVTPSGETGIATAIFSTVGVTPGTEVTIHASVGDGARRGTATVTVVAP
jgi:hypothetical protein